MDSKEEWDGLDLVSRWLIATRSGVTIVTLYSCAIGGLLAIRHGYFEGNWGISILAWLIITSGFSSPMAQTIFSMITPISHAVSTRKTTSAPSTVFIP